jgi:hypothetical protein
MNYYFSVVLIRRGEQSQGRNRLLKASHNVIASLDASEVANLKV